MELRNITTRKKGIALNQAFGAVLMLVLVAVLVIIAIVLFANLKTGAFSSSSTAVSITGESLTPSGNGTATVGGTLVSNGTRCNFGLFSLTTATNSSGDLLTVANYTTTPLGVVSNTSELALGSAAPWTLNYSYGWGDEACEATDAMISQFGTYPALIGLVGTIIFLGLVIGVLVASFVFGRKDPI